jgi:hypothetical protein
MEIKENPYEKLTDKEKLDKRRDLIVDIIHTEADYTAELEDFHEYFVSPLQVNEDGSATPFLKDDSFIESLNLFHTIVEASVLLSGNLQSANSGDLFAKSFQTFASAETLQAYVRYRSLLPHVLNFVHQTENARVLKEFLSVNCLPEGMTVEATLSAPTAHFHTFADRVQQFAFLTPMTKPELLILSETLACLQAVGAVVTTTADKSDSASHDHVDTADDQNAPDDDSSPGASDNDSEDEERTLNISNSPVQLEKMPLHDNATDTVNVKAEVEGEIIHLKDELLKAQITINQQNAMLDSKDKEMASLHVELERTAKENSRMISKLTELDSLHNETMQERASLAQELERIKFELALNKEPPASTVSAISFAPPSPPSSPLSSSMRKGSRRKSMAVSMECHNSLGYFSEDVDENSIIRDNIQTLMRSSGLKLEENKLYLHMLECMMAQFHLHVSLKNDPSTKNSWSLATNDVAVVCRQLIARVSVYLQKFIDDDISTDSEDQSEVLGGQPYPVQWLLKSFPDTAERSSGREWLPLHWALALEEPPLTLSEIRLLYEAYGNKTALSQPVSPLSVAVSKPVPSIEIVSYLVEECPNLATRTDADGSFALMHACACNCTSEIVEFLYETHEEAASTPDNFGCYSIHYACFSGYLRVVQFLLHNCPFLAQQRSGNGAFPLHDAVQNYEHGGLDMVRCVYNAYIDAVSQPDNNGALPLHHAARAANLEVVQLIHRAFPQVW